VCYRHTKTATAQVKGEAFCGVRGKLEFLGNSGIFGNHKKATIFAKEST